MAPTYTARQKALAIVPKLPGLLSALGSLYVIYDIVRNKRGHSKRNRLLLGLSTSDIIGSIAFGVVSSWAVPRGTPGVWLASGNEATCKTQGFLLQLANTTSPLYSGSLAFYYYVTICRGWSEDRVKKFELLLHFIPIFFGLATAIVGLVLDLYHSVTLWCWFGPPGVHYDAFRWGMAHSFIWSTIFFGAFVMISLYRKVRNVEEKNERYLQPHQEARRKRSRNVAIQGIFFTDAFFLAYIGGFLTRLVQSLTGKVYFELIIIMATLLPSQGIFNFIIYMRPRWSRSGSITGLRGSSILRSSSHAKRLARSSSFFRGLSVSESALMAVSVDQKSTLCTDPSGVENQMERNGDHSSKNEQGTVGNMLHTCHAQENVDKKLVVQFETRINTMDVFDDDALVDEESPIDSVVNENKDAEKRHLEMGSNRIGAQL